MLQKEKVDFPYSYDVYKENSQRRIKMRTSNLQEYQDDFFNATRKTSQIKVIQKFIGKLKVDNKSNYETILNQLDSLNMTKYIDEVSSIIANCVQEKEIIFYAEVAAKLNSEYEKVPSILIKDLIKCFNQVYQAPDDPKNRLKSIFLFTVELFVCGFSFSYKEVKEMIKKVFKAGIIKKSNHASQIEGKMYTYWYSSNIFCTFLGQFGESFTKRSPVWVQKWKQSKIQTFKFPEVLPIKTKEELTDFFIKYVKECFNLLLEIKQKIIKYQDELLESLKLKGEFANDTEKNYYHLIDKFTQTRRSLSQIADAISQSLNLEQLEICILTTHQIMAMYINKAENAQIFQDQFQKQIYQNFSDLVTTEDKQQFSDDAYNSFVVKLDNCKNVNDSNEICKAFSLINNKKNRKLLVKDCLEYRKEYHLVTPYLCRVIAIININFKDIGDLVNQAVFTQYQKIRDSTLNNFVVNDKKSRFMKYICEFTKFKVIDCERTLNCIEYFIDNLHGYNIELIISVLENVGRFLHLSENSANRFTFLMKKYENMIKAKSFPIFTTSQLINSINLLKPRKQDSTSEKYHQKPIQLEAQTIMSRCVINDTESMIQEIDQIMKKQEGEEAIKIEFLKSIQKFDFLNNYNYAYLLGELNYPNLTNFIIDRTIQNLNLCCVSGENQKTIVWGKFLAQLYKDRLIEKPLLYLTVENLFKIKNNYLGVINVVCNIFDACYGYLDSKNIRKNNERFILLVNFKRYISKCSYIPMLEEYQILEVLDMYEPDLCEINMKNLEEFMNFVEEKMKNQGKQVCYVNQLDRYLSKRNLKKKQTKNVAQQKERENQDSRKNYKKQEEKVNEVDNGKVFQVMKAFDKQFNTIMETTRKDYSSRIAKPVFLEKVFDKNKEKQEKKKDSITVIGRSGNKFIRKEVTKGTKPQ